MKKLLKKLTAVVSAAAVALTCVSFDGTVGLTAAAETVGAFTVTGGIQGTDYDYADNVLTIKTDTPITIRGTTTTDTLAVEKDKNANITLAGVNIDVSGTDYACAFKIADNSTGDVTITLADGSENTLISGSDCAGLQKNGAYSETLGKLTIKGGTNGTGSLTATGGYGSAGIGGGKGSTSNITITGGTVTASGGYNGAGIGGGESGSGSYITITGGNVTANGGVYNGAGIGGGESGSGSYITISGGIVYATGSEYGNGAGIGGGKRGFGSNIKISGGTVAATGGIFGAGIGGGEYGSGSSITISGGNVIATGGNNGAGIGGGDDGSGSSITISGGTVTATGGASAAGIGGGSSGSGSNIIISGGSVKAVKGSDSEYVHDIGGGLGNRAVTPTLADGTTKVFLYQINNASSIKIDGVEYPTTHNGENSIYPYLSTGFHTVNIDGTQNVIYMDESGNVTKQTAQTGNDLVVYGGTPNDDYTYSDGVLTIKTATLLMIKNANPNTATTNRIEVAGGVSANITLAGVNINVSSSHETAAFKIEDDSTGNVTITLTDGSVNTLISGPDRAGLQKNGGTSTGTLTIKGGTNGTGTLTATGGHNGAGIGGGSGGSGSNIEISGGTVTAKSGGSGAGIGGGNYGSGSNITISGGVVTTTGGYYAAGIGGGSYYNGSCSNITITGGSVKAVAGTDANAIGGGYNGVGAVTPTNGENNVYLLELDSANESLTIDGKSYSIDHGDDKVYVYLTQGKHTIVTDGASTTSNYAINPDNELVVIGSDFAVTATDSDKTLVCGTDYTYPADTGVLTIKSDKAMTIANADKSVATTDRIEVAGGVSANITFDGVNIDVSTTGDFDSGAAGSAAFKIADESTGNVTITLADGSKNTLKGGYRCAGLQKNGTYSETLGKLTIQGGTNGTGTLIATGGEWGAGIGSGYGLGSNITISGGTVTATGGKWGAGIGGGYGASSNITISGGTVTATGSDYGAGIGGGYAAGSYITISGGTVTATGGDYGAGIGGGNWGSGSNITISGGTVTANGGNNGAGIGGGFSCSGSDITISGGTVTANGGAQGAGIGGGKVGFGSNIKISGGNVTATGDSYGAGIGGGRDGSGSNIIITGGSVKATGANAIGGGNGAVTPTLGDEANTPVYLLEIANDSGVDITINETAYPTNHNGEKKIYAYLPAKTVEDPNVVKVGTEETKYVYDTKWLIVPTVTAPTAKTGLVYNGTAQELISAGSTDFGTLVYSLTEDGEYSAAIPKGTNAGTYTVYYKVQGNDNVSDVDAKTVSVSIGKAEATVTAKSYTVKFGNPLPASLEYETDGLIGTDTLSSIGANVTIGYKDDVTPSAINDYTIVVSGKAATTNYTLNYVNGTLKIIAKPAQTITADNVTLTYGDTGKKITASTSGDGAISYAVKTGDDVISVAADGTITVLKAGTATVEITAAETFDYAKVTKTITVTVNKKKVAVPTADSTEYTYNGKTQTYGVVSTADYNVTGGTQTNAGNHTIIISLNDEENYEWDGELGTYTFVIKKVPVTITANSYTIKVNTSLPTTYDYKVTGLVNNETLPIDVNVSCAEADINTVSTYTIAASGAADSTNYTYTYVPGTLTITTKEIQTITAADVTLSYGETDKKITAQASGGGTISYTVASGDDVIRVAADGTITVLKTGAATVEITAEETDDYAKAIKTVVVKVNKADVTIKANSYTVYVGAELPAFDFTVTGIAKEALGFTPELTCAATDTSTAGSYTITVTLEKTEDNCYIYTVQNGTLKVQKKSTSTGGSGGSGGSSSTSTNPSIGGSEKSWSEVAADLGKLTTGSEATIELNGNTTVPIDVIKAIADKDSKVTFVINSTYAWIVDGADITAPAAANLTLTKTSSTKHDGLRGIEGAQFRISDTGIPTSLEIAFKASHAGKFANLYRNVDGKLEFLTCAKLGADGKVILTDVTEKGEYVVMLCEFSDRPGDMDNDGIINPKDSYAVLKDFVEIEKGKNPLVADLNNDGFINPKDAMIILKKYLGIE